MIFLYLSQTRSESILLFPFPNLSIGIMANSIDDIFAIKDEGGERIQIRKALLIHLLIIIKKKVVVH
jgi:hypothetical protein